MAELLTLDLGMCYYSFTRENSGRMEHWRE